MDQTACHLRGSSAKLLATDKRTNVNKGTSVFNERQVYLILHRRLGSLDDEGRMTGFPLGVGTHPSKTRRPKSSVSCGRKTA
jgi:hypothetical protein